MANVISSHFIYKLKTNDDGSLLLKGRIVVHGNRDAQKDIVRIDSASADIMTVRFVINLSATLGFNLATADIRGAHMHSGQIMRDVYVIPPQDCHRKRGIICKFLEFPYGMTDAGRQWLLRVKYLMLGSTGMSRVEVVNQVFVKMHDDGIKRITANVIDDFLIAGNTHYIEYFIKVLSAEF